MESNSNNLGIGLENTPNSIFHILINITYIQDINDNVSLQQRE